MSNRISTTVLFAAILMAAAGLLVFHNAASGPFPYAGEDQGSLGQPLSAPVQPLTLNAAETGEVGKAASLVDQLVVDYSVVYPSE